MSKKLNGIAASTGIAVCRAFVLKTHTLKIETVPIQDTEMELKRLEDAIEKSKVDLCELRAKAEDEMGADKAAIFSAHLLVLEDPEFLGVVKDKIRNERINAESAIDEVARMYIHIFENMDNEYMKERAADIRDISRRVLYHLFRIDYVSLNSLNEEVILIARDLTPSDTAQLDRRYVKGFITEIGGSTSHSAIMARSLEIPAIMGIAEVMETVNNGMMVILDGIAGCMIVDPSEDEMETYRKKKSEYEQGKAEFHRLIDAPTMTRDGHQVELAANIGNPAEVKGILDNGAEAIGLFRTEFLYMGREDFPTEVEQFQAYKSVLENMGKKPVVIRTLDIGGDKQLPYMDLPNELNPFLGLRAIRLCLDRQDLFRIQLSALLRASAFGNLKIMFPMISTLGELRKAKQILEEEKAKLIRGGVLVSDKLEVGIMVEIPAAAIMADRFAKEVDFFSIGTNDLIQYTMAADRMNEQVSNLYQPYNPAILRLVQMVIHAAHEHGKWVGMCGEMAGDKIAIPLLIGLGLDEFSMSASCVLPAREQIGKLSKQELSSHMDQILGMDTAAEVEAYVREVSLDC